MPADGDPVKKFRSRLTQFAGNARLVLKPIVAVNLPSKRLSVAPG
jgi:hypothetical protein